MKVCQTPDAIYHIGIHEDQVSCTVSLPIFLSLDEKQAKKLENKIHDAMEDILKRYFK